MLADISMQKLTLGGIEIKPDFMTHLWHRTILMLNFEALKLEHVIICSLLPEDGQSTLKLGKNALYIPSEWILISMYIHLYIMYFFLHSCLLLLRNHT